MNTVERAEAIAEAAAPFTALLGPTRPADLLAWVEAELGNRGALDGWVPHGAGKSKATAPAAILHVVSGNTPHAALQSLVGGLLLGSRNLVKLPRGGLIEVDEFAGRLPEALRALVETSETMPDDWLIRADAVIVYGSDETVASLRAPGPASRTLPRPRPQGEPRHRDDPGSIPARRRAGCVAVRPAGCLSPHVFYVRKHGQGSPANTPAAGGRNGQIQPHPPARSARRGGEGRDRDLRAAYRFRAAGDLRVGLWEGGAQMDWTVIYEEDAWFPASCLNRVVFVKPLPEDMASAIGPAADHIGAVGLQPCTEELADRFEALRPSRFCPVGRMQEPPWTWHNGGGARLAPLVKWVDFEP